MDSTRIFVVTFILLAAPDGSYRTMVAAERAPPFEQLSVAVRESHRGRPWRGLAVARESDRASNGGGATRPQGSGYYARQSLRTTDRRLRRLIDEGVRSSETFRALVERLEQSDVVVYLECDGKTSPTVAGRLTFVAAAGGQRYVVVRLRPNMPRPQQLAIMAHELRHAVEIADAPAVVDNASLALEYQRIGHVNRWSATPGIAFDSDAAIQAGNRVLREISGMSGD